jgi:acyl-CoA synthetase (AMP-forming)/AMP-acid ligase II
MEAAVIGVPSAEWGEDIVAVVILRPGKQASADEIRAAALASGLTRFKCPVRIDFEPELLRNTIGKIQKQKLRSGYAAPWPEVRAGRPGGCRRGRSPGWPRGRSCGLPPGSPVRCR